MNQHRSLTVLIIGIIIMTINSLALPNGMLAGTDKMSPVAKQGTADNSKLPIIKIRHTKSLESLFSIAEVSGNSHLLDGVVPNGPCFGVSYATTYKDCTAVFYNSKMELVATQREPMAGGDQVMCMTAYVERTGTNSH